MKKLLFAALLAVPFVTTPRPVRYSDTNDDLNFGRKRNFYENDIDHGIHHRRPEMLEKRLSKKQLEELRELKNITDIPEPEVSKYGYELHGSSMHRLPETSETHAVIHETINRAHQKNVEILKRAVDLVKKSKSFKSRTLRDSRELKASREAVSRATH